MSMKKIIKLGLFQLLLIALFFPIQVFAFEHDLSISTDDIRFSTSKMIAGKKVRLYVKVRNVGSEDIRGRVSFSMGAVDLGDSQNFATIAGGSADAFVDFIVPKEEFSIDVKILDTNPDDDFKGNNEVRTQVFKPYFDSDNDGLTDDEDGDDDNDGLADEFEKDNACPFRLTVDSDGDGYNDGVDALPCDKNDWKDSDKDGIGDNADNDDDNDGITDDQEIKNGTDPFKKDSDGDGVDDATDAYPLDPKKNKKEIIRDLFKAVTGVGKKEVNKDESLAEQQINEIVTGGDNTTTSVGRSYSSDNSSFDLMEKDPTTTISNLEENNDDKSWAKYVFLGSVGLFILLLVFYVIKNTKTDNLGSVKAVNNKEEPKSDPRIIDLSKVKLSKKRKL